MVIFSPAALLPLLAITAQARVGGGRGGGRGGRPEGGEDGGGGGVGGSSGGRGGGRGGDSDSDDTSCPAPLTVSYPAPVVASGWEYRLVAQNLTRPRGILFDSLGGLLVVDRGAGILRFPVDDNGLLCLSLGEPVTLTDNEDVSLPPPPRPMPTPPNKFFTGGATLGWADGVTGSSIMVSPSPRTARPSTPRRRMKSTPGPTVPVPPSSASTRTKGGPS